MSTTKTVTAILRAAEIVKLLADGYTRLEEIYPKSTLSKSSAHRILKSLVESGFAFQDPLNRRYFLGPLFDKAHIKQGTTHGLLALAASDELEFLSNKSNETALLIIPNGTQRLILKEFCCNYPISLSLGEGSTQPIYLGSAGRVLLSQYTDFELNQIISRLALTSAFQKAINDKEKMIDEISRVRTEGFAMTVGEMFPDSAGISVPVRGYVCPVALCIFGPKFRFKPKDYLKLLSQSAARISKKLQLGMA